MRTFDRRCFLAKGAMASAAVLSSGCPLFSQSAQGGDATQENDLETTLRARLTSSDPRMWQLASDVYRRCILSHMEPARAPLGHTWIQPGGNYEAQWLWDTMFVVDLLSILPGQDETVRGIFQNYWDFQARWKAVKPEYSHGMIACYIAPYDGRGRDGRKWLTHPAFSQAPLLAWGMERVFRRTHDLELLHAGLQPLEDFHLWYWRERDLESNGLITVAAYSGIIQDARYETYDREVDLDGLLLTPHPQRTGTGSWYGDICIPANTAYLLQSERSLAWLASVVGDRGMQQRSLLRRQRGVAAMRKHMWDARQGCFVAVRRGTMEKVPVVTVGGFVPLFAGVPTRAQAARMSERLMSPDWSTSLPVPTVGRNDAAFSSSAFWRGDAWPAPDFQICHGLAEYGHKEQAAAIADRLVANALAHGISERYDSLTGEGLGVPYLGMSATVLTVALDRLTARYRMSVRV